MTRYFCDRCGKDITESKCYRINSVIYEHDMLHSYAKYEYRRRENRGGTLCAECYEDILEHYNSVKGERRATKND